MKGSQNLIGEKFGKGTVIKKVPKPKHLKKKAVYWLVKCRCGNTSIVDTTTLKYKWTNCGCVRQGDLTGEKFFNGTVVGLDGPDGEGHRIWNVKCECGNTYKTRTESLISGNTKSCGCFNFRNGKNHPHYKGREDLSGDYWSKLKKGAKNRNISFRVSIKMAWNLFLKQNKQCALTGWPITLSSSYQKDEQTASLDRIDSNKGYVVGNIQWVHKDINRMKYNFGEGYFVQACKAITERGSRLG